MSILLLQFFLPFSLVLLFLFKCLSTQNTSGRTLPPSPPKLPIIGNLHQLGSLPHRSLWSLSKRYCELMLLHLGSKPTLVVSSGNAVQEIIKSNDITFSNRPKLSNFSRIFYNGKDIAFANYGDYWRQMRGVCVQQLLSNKKVQSFRAIREEEAGLMVEKIKKSCHSEVNLREIIMTYTNDVICRASLGSKYTSTSNTDEGTKLKKLLNEAMKLIGDFSIGDCIPWLGWMDRVAGLTSKVERVAQGLDEILQKVLDENQNPLSTEETDDEKEHKVYNFVEILLEFKRQNNDMLPQDSIKAVILDMFAAGTDTTSTLIEWVMVEIIRHPSIMKEVQEEVRKNVDGRNVCENDLDKMTFLKAVIKETLRLHPSAPLLVIRESSQAVKLNGYDIASGTQVIVNAWAIQRDPFFWEEPEKFHPKRFLKSSFDDDYKWQDFHFIPFGAGRRICPGISFGMINVELLVATLMHKFDWKLPIGVDSEELDMTEITGLTVCRRDPLMAIATPRV